jgi:hypothetical protein
MASSGPQRRTITAPGCMPLRGELSAWSLVTVPATHSLPSGVPSRPINPAHPLSPRSEDGCRDPKPP